MAKVHKTIKMVVPANTGKVKQVQALLTPFRRTLQWLIQQLDRDFQQTGVISPYCPYPVSDCPAPLSARQLQTAYAQAHAAYTSFLEILTNKFRQVLYQAPSITKTDQLTLYRLNKYHLWYTRSLPAFWWVKSETGQLVPATKKTAGAFSQAVTSNQLKLARQVLKETRKWTSRPNLKRVKTLTMDAKVAQLATADHSRQFDRWLKISTLTKGHPVLLPLKNNPYLEQQLATGKLLNFVQVSIYSDHLVVAPVIEAPVAKLRQHGRTIGLDWGTVSLFTSSDGQLFGKRMLHQLRVWDQLVTDYAAGQQAAGKSLKQDAYYAHLQHLIRAYVKNEVGRILNRLAKQDIREIVVEHLKFSGGGLSKRMNRLLTRAGRKAVANKLARLTELNGIKVTEVNAAYTSQQCHRCGYVSRANRRTQKTFKCQCCGYTCNADINAARNIRDRRSVLVSWNSGSAKVRQKLLDYLQEQHRQTCRNYGDRATTETIGSVAVGSVKR